MIVNWAVGPTLEIVYQELERIIDKPKSVIRK